jgi:hypothetical protein
MLNTECNLAIPLLCINPKCPLIAEWVNKMWFVCIYTHTHIEEHYSTTKRNEILIYATTQSIMLSEISLTQKDKYYMIPLISGIWTRQIHRSKKQNSICHGLGEGQYEEFLLNGSEFV